MFTIESVRPGSATAEPVIRAYLTEVASRWFGRPATTAEVEQALRDEPYDDLQGDTGLLLVAIEDGHAIASAGVRFVTDGGRGIAELTKVYTSAGARGRGIGSALLRAVEEACRERGIPLLRLDTRAELAEACALYERRGFKRVGPFNDDPYSDRWYAKAVAPAA